MIPRRGPGDHQDCRKAPKAFFDSLKEGTDASVPSSMAVSLILLAEIARQQTGQGLAVAGLVAGHLVDSVVDRI